MGQKTRKSKTNENKKSSLEPSVLTALITAIVTITVALLGFPPIIRFFAPEPTLTPSPTFTVISIFSPTHLSSDTLTPSATNTFAPSAHPSLTDTPTPIIIPTDIPPSSRILVSLFPDSVSGKSPLTVKVDARSSYLLTPDGERHPCQTGACHYTWKVYFKGQQLGRADADSGGSIRYTFSDKGRYIVTVQVCWGKDRLYCTENSTIIEVTP
jgi:hypothetical protein